MKLPKLKPGDLVIVTWLDAYGESHLAWIDDDEIDLGGKYLVSSCGFFIAVTPKYLVLAGDAGRGAKGRVFNIPLGCIEKVERV